MKMGLSTNTLMMPICWGTVGAVYPRVFGVWVDRWRPLSALVLSYQPICSVISHIVI
jgi:hypothetical protein